MGMTPENFAYWLQGFFEITGGTPTLTPEQIKMVKDHLGYVFEHMARSEVGQSSLSTDTIHGTSVSSPHGPPMPTSPFPASVGGYPTTKRLIC